MIELREELARASAMLDVRRFDEASALLARLVSAEPESSRAWCLMARAHLGGERYTEAISAANRAVSLDPSDEWPHRLASNALVHLGNYPDALRAAREACRLAPGYWQTHVCVAQAALAGQRLDVAAEAASRARALAPNEPDVHFLSGKVSLARGDLTAAREHQERALALDPAHSGAMNELGRIRLRRHDTAGAIRHFISAARATPEERIYSRNIDVVLLRTVSRTIYVFTLIALILIWIPAVTHVDRLPFVVALGVAAAATAACFAWIVLRLPREARRLVRRTLRAPRVAAALALAVGGVAVAFGLVAFSSGAGPGPGPADRGGDHGGGAASRLRRASRGGEEALTAGSSSPRQRTARTERMDSTTALLASPYTAPTANTADVPNAAASGPSIAYPITPTAVGGEVDSADPGQHLAGLCCMAVPSKCRTASWRRPTEGGAGVPEDGQRPAGSPAARADGCQRTRRRRRTGPGRRLVLRTGSGTWWCSGCRTRSPRGGWTTPNSTSGPGRR